MNTKNTKRTLVLAAVAAGLTAIQTARAADFSPSDLSNRAIAASPRAKEQFPWLTRPAWPVRFARRAENVVSAMKNNRAIAASPRMIEQFPELARTGHAKSYDSNHSATGRSELAAVLNNRALAASPRTLELFPELARRSVVQPAKKSFELAPIK